MNLMTIELSRLRAMVPDAQVPDMDITVWAGKRCARCVVIPVINEGERIRNLLSRMKALDIASLADILIVDGGSDDGSLDPAFLRTNNVRALIQKKGEGKLSAQLRCAYAFAMDEGYEGVVTIDGNNKDDPDAIPAFLRAMEDGVDFVQGSRFIRGGEAENTPLARDLAIRLVHAPLLRFSSGFGWTDTTQGFRAYSRRLLLSQELAIFRNIFREYELLAYISHQAPQLGLKCMEIGTARRYPKGKTPTKISALRGNFRVFATLMSAVRGKYDVGETTNKAGVCDQSFAALLSALGLIASLMAFFPGWMSPDSLAQYNDALSGEFNDWHPVLMAWFWRLLDRIYTGPALMLIFHLVLYWGAWLMLSKASRKLIGPAALLIPLLGFWPGLLYPLGQIWKDVAFASVMFFAWAFTFLKYAREQRIGILGWLLLIALSTYSFGVKPNGIVVLPFLFAFAAYVDVGRQRNWTKIASQSVLLPVVAVLAANGIASTLKIKHTHPFQYTQSYDLLGMSVRSRKVLLPNYITSKVGNSTEKLKPLYWPGGNNLMYYNTAGNLTTIEPEDLRQLEDRWIEAIEANPSIYFAHRWSNFLELIRWGSDQPATVAHPAIVENSLGLSFSPNTFSHILARTGETHPKIYFPWIYLLVSFASAVVLLACRRHRFLTICFTGSAIAFVLPHIFIAPSADYRYLYYSYFHSIITGFFAVIYLIKILNDLRKRH